MTLTIRAVRPDRARHDLTIIAAAGEQIERMIAALQPFESEHLGRHPPGIERDRIGGPARRGDGGGEIGLGQGLRRRLRRNGEGQGKGKERALQHGIPRFVR